VEFLKMTTIGMRPEQTEERLIARDAAPKELADQRFALDQHAIVPIVT
jgi:hypothetical protein